MAENEKDSDKRDKAKDDLLALPNAAKVFPPSSNFFVYTHRKGWGLGTLQ